MLVKDCMTRHPIMISPKMPAAEAQKIMADNHIRHLPVAGMVSDCWVSLPGSALP